MAVADIDRNGVLDALFLNVDEFPIGEDTYRYRIGWNVRTTGAWKGQFSSWSGVTGYVGVGGWDSWGGGVAFGDVDSNGQLDAVFMVVDDANEFRYRIRWNIGTNGEICGNCWSGIKAVGAPSAESQGGGVALTDLDGDGWLDMLLLSVDNPLGENNYRYRIGYALNAAGDAVGGWSATWGFELVPSRESRGGDLAVGDVDKDGWLDMLFMHVSNAGGANDIRFRVRLGI